MNLDENLYTFMRQTKERLMRLETKQGHKTVRSVGLAIASGIITVDYREFYRLATESGLTDDLVTINGGSDGYFLTLMTAITGQTITLKTGTGNLRLFGDSVLSATDQSITLRYNADISKWVEIARKETTAGGGGSPPAGALLQDGSVPLQGNLSVDSGVTIDGIDIGNPGDGLAVDGVQLVIDQTFGFVWTTQHEFQAGLIATHVGATTTLTLNPTTDLILDPGSNTIYVEDNVDLRSTDWVSGFLGTGWGLTNPAGASLLDIRRIQVEELHAYVFISDIERVRVGETFVTQSMGILSDPLTTPAIAATTALTVEDVPQAAGALFLNNEWVLLQLIDRSGGGIAIEQVWGQVNSYVDNGDGTQTYTYTHRHGTVGLTLNSGSYVLSFGLSGDGYIHESVIDSAGSPYTRYATWVTDPSVPGNRTVHVQVGNLDSVTDLDLNPSGWGLYADNVFLNGDLITANGLVRILNGVGINLQEDSGPLNDNALVLQWWPDITSMVGDATFSVLAWTNPTPGPHLDENQAQILVSPTGGNRANLLFYVKDVETTGHQAYIQMWGGSASDVLPGEINIVADLLALGGFGTDVRLDTTVTTENIVSKAASSYDIGTAGVPYSTLYVDTIIASTITGGIALGGQVWQYDPGHMFIRSNSASNRTLSISNPGAGIMSLDVEGDISLGGVVDGVDIAAHAANANAHHSQSHVLATTAALGGDHTVTGLTAGQVLKATSATTALFVALDHSELAGLTSGDPHTQYVSVATARTITAVHTFSPASPTAPFILAANAQGQTVTGLKADFLNQTITAGVGLTGGGALTGGVTVTLGTPSSLSINSSNTVTGTTHEHQVLYSSNPGAASILLASTVTGGLTLQTLTLAGSGLVLTAPSGVLAMGDNTDVVNKLGMAWIGYLGTGMSNYAGFGHRSVFTTTSYALLQSSVGETYLNAASTKQIYHRINNADVMAMGVDRLNPAGSGLKSLGDYNRKWSELFASQLIVENLVASNVMATIGGRILVAPTAKLTRDIVLADTTIYLDSNIAQPLDELYMAGIKGAPQTEHMRILSGPVSLGGGEYSYVVIRNTKGQGNLATDNNGFEFGSTSGWTAIYSNISAFNAFTADPAEYVRGAYSGKLVSNTAPGENVGISTTATLASGVIYSVSYWIKTFGSTNLVVDVTGPGGLDTTGRNITGSGTWTRYNDEFTTLGAGTHTVRFRDFSPTGGIFWVEEIVIEAKYDTTGWNWYIGDANVDIGYAIGSGYLDLTSLTTIQGHYGPTMAVYAHTSIGGQPQPVVAVGNLRSFVDYSADTMGWAVGNNLMLTPTTGFKGLTADVVNGLRLFNVDQKFYNSGTLTVSITPTGRFKLGTNVTSAGTTGLDFDPATGTLLIGNASYPGTVSIRGSITITGGSGYANISDKPTTLAAIDSTSATKLGTIATGATVGATWGTNLGSIPGELTDGRVSAGLNSSGFLQTKVLPGTAVGTPGGAGLFLGSDKMGYYNGSAWKVYIDNTGKFFFGGSSGATVAWDGTDLYGTDGTTVQWYARSTDGKLYAGGGNIFLDSLGITLIQGVAAQNSITWRASSAGTVLGSLSTSNSSVLLAAKPPSSGVSSNVKLESQNPFLGTVASLTVTADGSGSEQVSIRGGISIINPQTAVKGLVLDMPSGAAANAMEWQLNSVTRAFLNIRSTTTQLVLNGFDNGTGIGPTLIIDRNSNGSTPAAGNVRLTARGGADYYFWPDNAGNARMGTTAPTNAQDTSGTVIGTQTSMAAAKNILVDLSKLAEVKERIKLGAAAVRRFIYKSGSYNNQEFEGVVIDYAPAYGMDRTKEHPSGKSLNEIEIFGDLLRVTDWAVYCIEQLVKKVYGIEYNGKLLR